VFGNNLIYNGEPILHSSSLFFAMETCSSRRTKKFGGEGILCNKKHTWIAEANEPISTTIPLPDLISTSLEVVKWNSEVWSPITAQESTASCPCENEGVRGLVRLHRTGSTASCPCENEGKNEGVKGEACLDSSPV